MFLGHPLNEIGVGYGHFVVPIFATSMVTGEDFKRTSMTMLRTASRRTIDDLDKR
jgi:hypothetical protein